jgi:hypothetical protein
MHIYHRVKREIFLMLNKMSFDFCAYFEKVREIEITQLE